MGLDGQGLLRFKVAPIFAGLYDAKARYKAVYGGRGSGKSWDAAQRLIHRCIQESRTNAVCIREVQQSIRDSSKRLLEMTISALGVGHFFEVQHDRIMTPGGGQIVFKGMRGNTAEGIKSLESMDIAWVDEAQQLSSRSLELLLPTIRTRGSELWFNWNPRLQTDPVDRMFRGKAAAKNALVVQANYDANPFFPPELEEERLRSCEADPVRYAHIWEGAYEPIAVGAIWDPQTIEDHRVPSPPQDLGRIVVAVDPAISSDEGANEHGIVVVGMGTDDRAYVLDDLSATGKPDVWGERAVAAYDKWGADAVVIEVNQGGEMGESVLRSFRRSLPIRPVRARHGKHVRAEPIAAQYKLGAVCHVGTYPDLEAQMCQMTLGGFEGHGSPDRVDALVWGLTDLFPNLLARQGTRAMPTVASSDFRVFA
ncbi:MAG: PBSX family phage terminase large subunit [Pseudomonadota bacterium]